MLSQTDTSEAEGNRGTDRLNQIVDIAAQLFARRGYDATGTAELCEAAGLGKGALYYHIGSKENLLWLIHQRVMDELLERAERVQNAEIDPLEKLRRLGYESVRITTTYPEHVWVFLHEYPSLTGERAETFRRSRQKYEQMVGQVLREAEEAGLVELPHSRYAELAWLGMHNYTYIWYREGGRLGPDEIADWYYQCFTNGVGTR